MILYHFTASSFLQSIREEGLTRGEVPLSSRKTINGVWLTTDPNPEGHGLSDGGQLSPAEIRDMKARGFLAQNAPDIGISWSDKRSARITVRIPSTDRNLKRWTSWGRKRLTPEWFEALSGTGGGHQKARSWYICFRAITPAEFLSVEVLRDEI